MRVSFNLIFLTLSFSLFLSLSIWHISDEVLWYMQLPTICTKENIYNLDLCLTTVWDKIRNNDSTPKNISEAKYNGIQHLNAYI